MMPINNPRFPPNTGLIEKEVNGQRMMRMTGERSLIHANSQAVNDLDAVIVDQEYRITLLELGLNANDGEVN